MYPSCGKIYRKTIRWINSTGGQWKCDLIAKSLAVIPMRICFVFCRCRWDPDLSGDDKKEAETDERMAENAPFYDLDIFPDASGYVLVFL